MSHRALGRTATIAAVLVVLFVLDAAFDSDLAPVVFVAVLGALATLSALRPRPR